MACKLETPLGDVPKLGALHLQQLDRLRLRTVSDVLLNRPVRYEDRAHPIPICNLETGAQALIRGTLVAHGVNRFRKGQKSVYEHVIDDGTGRLHCRYWNMPYLQAHFRTGMELFVFGKVSGNKPTAMDAPEYERIEEGLETVVHLNRIVPVYRLTEGLPQRWLRALVWRLLHDVEVPETTDEGLVCSRTGVRRLEQFRRLHFPSSWEEAGAARQHFALEELIALQRNFAKRRQLLRSRAKGHVCAGDNRIIRPFLKRLPFRLTTAQTRVLREIRADLGRVVPMRRLLHGDVGSGKTVVAACAALMCLESGYDVALMAPTEILAVQHQARLREWLAPLGVDVELLTGNRKPIKRAPASAFTVGTHALIHQSFRPDRLGLVIIDEQHRFGVVQRERLLRKGSYPHLLVMTATPIPRTLGLTLYGDLDLSRLDEVPARAGCVRTHLRSAAELPRIWSFVRDQLAAGHQAYIVYPRIEAKAGASERMSVRDGYDRLREQLAPHTVGLLHGGIDALQASQIMEAFRQRKLQALVATTVIEVGLDVPNATVMVIENAGRYGLSQLHQLRGRIGRGGLESHCILVEDSLRPEALERLQVLLRCDDGFQLAEEDLRIRGTGDFLGTRQSGLPRLKFADLSRDRELVLLAREVADQHPR